MLASAQASFDNYIAKIRASGRIPQLLDYAHARHHAAGEQARQAQEAAEAARVADRDPHGFGALLAELRALEPANDDPELDALLDGLDTAVPADEATPLVAADNDDAAPAPLAGNPKKRAAKPRVSFARDKRHLSVFNDFVPDVRTPRTRPLTGPLVGDTTHPSTSPISPSTPSLTTLKRQQANDNDTRKAPAWDRTTEIIRGHTYARTVSTTGGGVSWTLNLGGKIAKAANDNPHGLKDKLHDRLVKALKASALGAREFVFAVERTRSGRWHLHGILDVADDERGALEAILRQVGGSWGSEHHRDRQVQTDVLWGPDGWLRYMRKDSAATRRLLGTKSILSVTRGCRRRAEELWEASRRRQSSAN